MSTTSPTLLALFLEACSAPEAAESPYVRLAHRAYLEKGHIQTNVLAKTISIIEEIKTYSKQPLDIPKEGALYCVKAAVASVTRDYRKAKAPTNKVWLRVKTPTGDVFLFLRDPVGIKRTEGDICQGLLWVQPGPHPHMYWANAAFGGAANINIPNLGSDFSPVDSTQPPLEEEYFMAGRAAPFEEVAPKTMMGALLGND